MRKNLMHILLLTCVLIPAIAQAFGNSETWSRGWAQGMSEFVIKGKDQSQLYLTCEDYGSQPVVVIFKDPDGHEVSMDGDKSLQVSIDGEEPIDISESGSRVGSNNLVLAWTQLRNGKQVSVSGEGLKSSTFTLAGAAKVLPEFGTHGCVAKASL